MSVARSVAAVTGATGFLGRRLVPALVASGWRVRVLVRRAPPGDFWEGCFPELVAGDLSDHAALRALTADSDVLIHGAGLIKAARRSDFFAVNAEGARNAAQAAPTGGLLLISSLAAREPRLSDYAASKQAGEALALAIAGQRLTVVRPPAIYGPGDRETLGLFRLAARSPILPLPGPATARLALAHVDDVVAAIVALVGRASRPPLVAIGGARPEGYGWREILEAAAWAMGRRPRFLPIAAWCLQTAAAISETAGRMAARPVIFTRGKAREILHGDWSVSLAELEPGGPPARIGLEQGFAQTVAWYRAHGWLAR